MPTPTIVKLVPQDFELFSGNDKTLRFRALDEFDAIIDLTGATIIWALAKSASAKSRLIEYTSPTNVTITDPAEGLFEVAIQNADTEALKGGEYYHEVRIESAAGSIITVAYGTVFMRHNVIDA